MFLHRFGMAQMEDTFNIVYFPQENAYEILHKTWVIFTDPKKVRLWKVLTGFP